MQTTPPRLGARERMAMRGPAGIDDEDLISLVLGTGGAGRHVETVSAALLRSLGGVSGLTRAGAGDLATEPGIGPTKAARLMAAVELGRRAVSSPLVPGQTLQNSRQVFDAFGPALWDQAVEHFWAVALDSRHRVVSVLRIAAGGLSACPVSPADLFRPLLRERAAAAILLHNHPSGEPDPSPDDVALTERLSAAAALLGLRILDHIIVGHGDYFSFMDSGLIPQQP